MMRQEQEYRTIPLTQGKVAIVDLSDYEWLSQWKWCAQVQPDGVTYYAVRGTPSRSKEYMHRAILRLPFGDPRYGDHIDLDTLNNRRSNLRIATPQSSAFNRGVRSDNSSGRRGVSLDRTGKWQARIQVSKRQMWLGAFSSKEEAYKVYCEAAKKYHGEFARSQ